MNNISSQSWLTDKATQKIMQALSSNGKEARFVGGCVRDALLRRPVHDIDIATQEKPEAVLKLLEGHQIKAIATGIEHGTVTAVYENKTFEITTLRRDIETDGRHAVVSFTEDWLEDAQRRDFTFNAMSADKQGEVYDPFDGLEDLRAGRVIFVGDANARIKEDYLRILRFFRFSAYYAKARVDDEAVEACTALAHGIKDLSGERISQEVLRLLEAPRAAKYVSLMIKTGVMSHLLEQVEDPTNLEMLSAFEDTPDRLRRLAVLLPKNRQVVEACCARFRLSNAQKKRLIMARCADEFLIPSVPENKLRAFLHRYGAITARDHVFLYWAEKGFTGIGPNEQKLLDNLDQWEANPQPFPLQGRDLLERGFEAGPKLGQTLKQIESWWCRGGCIADKETCLTHLDKL